MPIRERRPEEYTPGTSAYHAMRLREDPNYQVPDDFGVSEHNGQTVVNRRSGVTDFLDKYGPYIMAAPAAGGLGYAAATGTGVFGGAGAAGAAGASGAAGAGPEMIAPGITATMGPESIASIGGGVASSGGGGFLGGLSRFLGNPGGQLLAGAGMSLLGSLFGPEAFQRREPFTGAAAPQQTLTDALQGIRNLGQTLESRGPVQLRSTVSRGPSPVQIPGLPFQIGGGLGHDPALDDPTVLQTGGGGGLGSAFSNMAASMGDPGQGQQRPGGGGRAPASSSVRQRKPEGLF